MTDPTFHGILLTLSLHCCRLFCYGLFSCICWQFSPLYNTWTTFFFI